MLISVVRAAPKAASARLRQAGMLSDASGWEERAAVCETCHLRVVRCGVSYCGVPLLEFPDRDEAVDGCGCPCRDKAKSPGEHCPLPGAPGDASAACSCKWCRATAVRPVNA